MFMQTGQYANAAKLVVESPRGCLRTPQTLHLFRSLPITPTSSPLRDYFQTLLEYGIFFFFLKLNTYLSFCRFNFFII
jgi:hypothetical protein